MHYHREYTVAGMGVASQDVDGDVRTVPTLNTTPLQSICMNQEQVIEDLQQKLEDHPEVYQDIALAKSDSA